VQRGATWCSVLQYVAVCCSAVYCAAACCVLDYSNFLPSLATISLFESFDSV